MIFIAVTIFFGIFYLRNREEIPDELTLLDREGGKISYLYPNYISQVRVEEKFKILHDKKLTEQERYSALDNLAFFFGSAYSDTNDAKIRKYLVNLGKYGEKEFPALFKKGPFNPVCQDPSCAPPTPEEIKSIITQIKSSDAPKEDIERITKALSNASMVEDDAEDFKFYAYNQAYTDIKSVADTSSSSALLKTHEDLGIFLSKKYPEYWELYKENVSEGIKESFLENL